MLSTVSRIIDRKCDGDGIKRLDAIPEAIDSDSAKRPDILVFDEKIVFSDTKPGENPINSIEFKRPGRDDYTATDNPVMQSFDLVQKIRAGKFVVNRQHYDDEQLRRHAEPEPQRHERNDRHERRRVGRPWRNISF